MTPEQQNERRIRKRVNHRLDSRTLICYSVSRSLVSAGSAN